MSRNKIQQSKKKKMKILKGISGVSLIQYDTHGQIQLFIVLFLSLAVSITTYTQYMLSTFSMGSEYVKTLIKKSGKTMFEVFFVILLNMTFFT